MNTVLTSGKAIWRKPNENTFHTIISGKGNDEFFIAPFIKSEDILKISGEVTIIDESNISSFLSNLDLKPSPSQHSTSETYYCNAVENAITAIKQEQFEKVVLARRLYHESTIDIPALYLQLATQYPAAFVYCFYLENGTCMIGASPETLLKGTDKELYTEALGGTNQVYGFSNKEHKEHRQIITDITNKLESLSYSYITGKTIERNAGNITHLATPITISGKDKASDATLLNLLHPTSAVCGLPYSEALAFIISHEDFKREYYSGYLGINSQNSFAYFVNLRCASIFSDAAYLYAGAGINRDSIAKDEWIETNEKIATIQHYFNV